MKNPEPLDELEMVELLIAAYPERFPNGVNENWDAALEFADQLSGFDAIAGLLSRIALLTMPAHSGLTGRLAHALGPVTFTDSGEARMVAAVRRHIPRPAPKAGD